MTLVRPSRALLVVASLVAGCGYHAVHGGDARERLRPSLGTIAIADAVAADEVLAGARETLAREGALGGGGDPELVLDVTRIDESADSISAQGGAPSARGLTVAVVGRGLVQERAAHAVLRDTGDMRATVTRATPGDARADVFAHDDAVRAAARRLGRKLALRALGEPVASEDGEGRLP